MCRCSVLIYAQLFYCTVYIWVKVAKIQKVKPTESSLTTVSIFLKAGSGSMLTTIISSERYTDDANVQTLLWEFIQEPHCCILHNLSISFTTILCKKFFYESLTIMWPWVLVFTCGGPVVGLLVCPPVDELPQGGHSIVANQSVAAKSSTVHHSNVQWWVKQLIFWQILTQTFIFNSRFTKGLEELYFIVIIIFILSILNTEFVLSLKCKGRSHFYLAGTCSSVLLTKWLMNNSETIAVNSVSKIFNLNFGWLLDGNIH